MFEAIFKLVLTDRIRPSDNYDSLYRDLIFNCSSDPAKNYL